MKAIMVSIKPKWCAKIMNGEKTIEVRKNKALASAIQKLIDENGYADIYVYCSKGGGILGRILNKWTIFKPSKWVDRTYNGKVVFKFRCYKVEEIFVDNYEYQTDKLDCFGLLFKSQLEYEELHKYLADSNNGYAIHISELEIFDNPKELSEFRRTIFYTKCEKCPYANDKYACEAFGNCHECIPLTKAPQNFCYLEEN